MKRLKFRSITLLVLCSCFSLSSNANLSSEDIKSANKAAEIMIPSISEFLGKPVKLTGISLGDSLPENKIDIPNAVCNDYLLVANYMELYRTSFSLNFGSESYKDFKNPVANAIKTLDLGVSSQHSECLMKEKGWSDEMKVLDYMMENAGDIMAGDKRFNKLNDFDVAFGVEETVQKMVEATNK